MDLVIDTLWLGHCAQVRVTLSWSIHIRPYGPIKDGSKPYKMRPYRVIQREHGGHKIKLKNAAKHSNHFRESKTVLVLIL